MSEQSTQIPQPVTSSNLIDDGPLVLDEIQTDEINEKTTGAGVINGFGMIPEGGIIAWSGSIANIPVGWALCNGANGTPDLRGRFILGAQADSGATYDVGDTGGAASVTLSENQIPEHRHTITGASGAGSGGGYQVSTIQSVTGYTGYVGGGQSHENMPPFFVLAFIMRVAS